MTDKPAQVSIEAQIEAVEGAARFTDDEDWTVPQTDRLRAAAKTLRYLQLAGNQHCAGCEYDEADGALFRHCARCQLSMCKTVWSLTHAS